MFGIGQHYFSIFDDIEDPFLTDAQSGGLFQQARENERNRRDGLGPLNGWGFIHEVFVEVSDRLLLKVGQVEEIYEMKGAGCSILNQSQGEMLRNIR